MKRTGTLILGSASARRRQLLETLGIPFTVVIPRTEEIVFPDDPRRTAEENALRKARWIAARHPRAHVLTADTVVVFEGRCLTKPANRKEAMAFLRRFSGKTQTVVTAVALTSPPRPPAVRSIESIVKFRVLDDAAIRDYHALVDPLDKAGGYNIGEHGDRIVESHTGSLSNIMGLPLEMLRDWLASEGLPVAGVP